MSEYDNKENKPVEIFCPICGFTSYINQVDEQFEDMTRDKKVEYVKTLQKSEHPVFMCTRCENPEQTPGIMEVR